MAQLVDFDATALYRALDHDREARGLSWSGVAREVWQLSSTLNDARRDHPISPSTIASMGRRGDVSCQHALFMLRWLRRTPESFLPGVPERDDAVLPLVGPDRRLRWHLRRTYEAMNEERQRRAMTWKQLAIELRCTPNQLTGLRTAKFATSMTLAMRIAQWLDRPAADFIYAGRW